MEKLKCPNCKAYLGPTGKCEYCGTRVDVNIASGGPTQNSIYSFPKMLEKTQENLRRLKLFPKPSFLENTFKLFLSVVTLGIYTIIRKRIGKQNSFDWIEAEILSDLKNIKTYHSGNSEVDRITQELDNEYRQIKKEYNSTKRKTSIGCFFIFVLFSILLFKMLSSCNSDESTINDDEYISSVQSIENDIRTLKFDNARLSADKLDMDKRKDYLRKIQLAEVAYKLENIKKTYSQGKIDDAVKEYNTLEWIPIDNPEYDYKEKEAVRKFNQLKDSIKSILDIKN